jgi:hypothetical protein
LISFNLLFGQVKASATKNSPSGARRILEECAKEDAGRLHAEVADETESK